MEIRQGMIGFSGGTRWIQRAIGYFTDSEFSHSFMVKNNADGIPCALETTFTTVMFGPVADKLQEKNWVEMWDVIAPEEQKAAALETCLPYIGSWYSYLSYLWFLYAWAKKKLGMRPPTKMWKWCTPGNTCTELTQKYPKYLFPELFEGLDENIVTPPVLRNIMVEHPDKFVLLGWYVPRELVEEKRQRRS